MRGLASRAVAEYEVMGTYDYVGDETVRSTVESHDWLDELQGAEKGEGEEGRQRWRFEEV